MGTLPLAAQNHMEKNMEHHVQTGVYNCAVTSGRLSSMEGVPVVIAIAVLLCYDI